MALATNASRFQLAVRTTRPYAISLVAMARSALQERY
jgi:hypothetical protein